MTDTSSSAKPHAQGLVPVVDASQAASWDDSTRKSGVPSRVLMESAGRGTAHVIARELGPELESGVLIVAGHGNNGGDGWVVARALHAAGVPVSVAEYQRDRTPDCEANRSLALADGVPVAQGEWPPTGVVVDALLGTGATGAPRGAVGELAARIAASPAAVVAIDGPTGLDLSTGEPNGPVRADLTVTFGGLRRGHVLARDWCGVVVAIDIGFTDPASQWPHLVTDRWATSVLPAFSVEMHKGDRGKILVVGGEPGMAGAVHHAARAALAAGAGLVRVAASPQSVQSLQSANPDVTAVRTTLGAQIEPELREMIEWCDALVIGPGLGRAPARAEFVCGLLELAACPAVVDADALRVGREALDSGNGSRVFTPHIGEFRALTDESVGETPDPFAASAEAASKWEREGRPFALLLKGVPTVIANGVADVRVVAAGNPALATGGSGDVLAGLIATFLGRRLDPMDAAALGAHLMGRAAELASEEIGVRSTRPADVLAAVPAVFQHFEALAPPDPPVLVRLAPPATA